MGLLGAILIGLASLVNLVCFVMTLIKLFGEEGAGKGILGLICGIYTFIWGWQNASRMGIRNVMSLWTVGIAVSILGRFLLS